MWHLQPVLVPKMFCSSYHCQRLLTQILMVSLQPMWLMLLLLERMAMVQLHAQLTMLSSICAQPLLSWPGQNRATYNGQPQKAPASTGLAGICMPDSNMTSARDVCMTFNC